MERIVRIIKKVKIRNILILILLIIFNTYAWFIYATRVSMDLSVHVSSWNVEFSTGEFDTSTNILVEIDKAYPGMQKFVKNISVKNKGEMKAKLSYEILSLRVMDEKFVVGENITEQELENKIKTEYPFKINILSDDTQLVAGTGEGSFQIAVEWPFESGNDEADTLWGNKAYDYYEANPDKKCIEIQMKLIAKQIAD